MDKMAGGMDENQWTCHDSMSENGFSSVTIVDPKENTAFVQMFQSDNDIRNEQLYSAEVEIIIFSNNPTIDSLCLTNEQSCSIPTKDNEAYSMSVNDKPSSDSSLNDLSNCKEKIQNHEVCESNIVPLVQINSLDDNNKLDMLESLSKVKSNDSKQRRETRKCCAEECQSATKTNKTLKTSYYTFPPTVVRGQIHEENIARCKKWVLNCGNKTLLSIPTAGLNKKYFLCQKHFTNDQFYNSSRKTLLPSAVPTLFSKSIAKEINSDFPVYGHSLDMFADNDIITTFDNNRTYYRQHNCAVLYCPSKDSEMIRYYPFPNVCNDGKLDKLSLARCVKWIQSTGDFTMSEVDIFKIHEQYEICENHFEISEFADTSKKRLKSHAIPTICNVIPLAEQIVTKFLILEETLHEEQDEMFFQTPETIQPIQSSYCEQRSDGITSVCTKQSLDEFQKNFNDEMKGIDWYTCNACKETFISKRKLKMSCLHNKRCNLFTEDNNMDPGDVPEELSDLTYIEEQLIARVHPIVSVYKIKGHQFGYSGNVINFSQSVSEFAKKLPHKISNLSSVITVKSQDTLCPKEFLVRADKLRKALEWLKANNHYYYDIDICEENLDLLPADGNIYNDIISVINIESENHQDENEITEQEGVNEEETEEEIITIEETSVPQIQCSNQNDKVQNVLEWPTVSKEALNEFTTVGYIAQAFPCLFPTGKADINAPRDKKLKPAEYFKHMLRYKDKRFTMHPRFRFYALNSLMRWNALQGGHLFVKKHSEFKDLTVEQLKQKIENNPRLINTIMYQCSNMRGTKQYWKAKCYELVQMIEQLKMPTLFFTLSAADLHWPGLFKLLAPGQDIESLTTSQRAELIQKFPIIVDQYFSERVESFINKVLVPKYKVKDFWYRVEYQHRGSPHVHGLLWLENAPDVSNIQDLPTENIQEIIQYFDELISTTHPNINCPPAVIHPCRKNLEDIIDLEKDLAEILNKVQRHTKCTEGYCLKFNKITNKKQCRFEFPKDTISESGIQITDRGDFEFVSKRNDPLLNKYNHYILQTWRANMDIAPVLSKRALINYLAKYVSKVEPKSKNLEQTLKQSLQNIQQDKKAKSAIQSLYIKACSERDFSAQEVGHLIMGEKLVGAGGRDFISIYFRFEDDWVKVPHKENIQNGMSIIDKYKRRSCYHENKTLWHMAKNFILPSERKRVKQAIVLVYPNLTFKGHANSNENYFKLKVLLHLPWRNESDFSSASNFISWEQLYKENVHHIQLECPDEILQNVQTTADDQDSDEDMNDTCNEIFHIRNEDWMVASRMHPDQNVDEPELGRRAIDLSNDWNESLSKYQQYGNYETLQSFIAKAKEQHNSSQQSVTVPQVQFTEEQTKVITLLDNQIQCIKNPDMMLTKDSPKVVVVQGQAGTGKSLLIQACASKIQENFGKDAVLLLGPTGVASLNIGGHTIHSKLHVSLNMPFQELQNQSERKFINDMQDVKFLIIDEFSMVGCKLLAQIDKRCRQATGNYEEDFGGICVFFFGDIRQLPPVSDIPLYTNTLPSSALALHGKIVFDRIAATIVLSQVQRQTDPQFKTLLANMSQGCITDDDYKLISTRFKSSVSYAEKKQFDDVLQLFPTRNKVEKFNKKCLQCLVHPITNAPVPIARIEAEHNCFEAAKGSSDDAGGLKSVLYLGQHAKIMLKINLWTEMGLVNGAMGTIVDILYETGTKPPEQRPVLLICNFPCYKGPYLGNDPNQKLVPIAAITKSWTAGNGDSCTRTNMPVVEAYACSIHKAQGLTLSKVCVDIGDKDFAPGLSYVAFSRARTLEGLLLEDFSKERFLKINKSRTIMLRDLLLNTFLQKTHDFES